jgi:hypothetical protein
MESAKLGPFSSPCWKASIDTAYMNVPAYIYNYVPAYMITILHKKDKKAAVISKPRRLKLPERIQLKCMHNRHAGEGTKH